MNKTELVAAIAERTELTKKDADQALKAFIDVVGDELSNHEAHHPGRLRRAAGRLVQAREEERPSRRRRRQHQYAYGTPSESAREGQSAALEPCGSAQGRAEDRGVREDKK